MYILYGVNVCISNAESWVLLKIGNLGNHWRVECHLTSTLYPTLKLTNSKRPKQQLSLLVTILDIPRWQREEHLSDRIALSFTVRGSLFDWVYINKSEAHCHIVIARTSASAQTTAKPKSLSSPKPVVEGIHSLAGRSSQKSCGQNKSYSQTSWSYTRPIQA